jgi:DNA ligase 1
MRIVELYKYTNASIRYWAIEADYDFGCLYIRHGVLGGSLQEDTEDVILNNSGRDIIEQVDLRLDARVKSKKDIGYRESIEESKACQGNNTIGYHRPMLAKRIDQVSSVDYSNSFLQPKYDGHRCLITRTSSGLIAYSRNGRVIKTIDHILSGIHIPIGTTIDGELYVHGESLQSISSWVKKKQFNTLRLQYIAYDMVSSEKYNYRYNALNNFTLGKNSVVAPTDKGIEAEHIPVILKSTIASGFEGLMLRQNDYPYQPGVRSLGLLKIKEFLDSEFKVLDITPSKDGWGILTCITESGVKFDVSAPGTMMEKHDVMRRKDHYIGKTVTVKYANLTKDGVPFHPVAERWREDI